MSELYELQTSNHREVLNDIYEYYELTTDGEGDKDDYETRLLGRKLRALDLCQAYISNTVDELYHSYLYDLNN